MNDCNKYSEHLHLYPLEVLSIDEQRSVEQHLRHCPHCKSKLLKVNQTLNLTRQVTHPQMPADFWEEYDLSLDEKIKQISQVPTGRRNSRFAQVKNSLLAYKTFSAFKMIHALSFTVVILLVLGISWLRINKPEQETVQRQENPLLIAQQVTETSVSNIDRSKKSDQALFSISKDFLALQQQRYEQIKPEIIYPTQDLALHNSFLNQDKPFSEPFNSTLVKETMKGLPQQSEDNSMSPALEEELILQEMLLMVELGETMDLAPDDEQLIDDIQMISDFIWI